MNVVHPAHAHSNDAAYHDVMNKLSGKRWSTVVNLAIESKHSEKDVKRVLKHMLKEELIEEGKSPEGKCYRIEGYSHD